MEWRQTARARIVVLGDRDLSKVAHREVDAALALFPPEVDGDWVDTESVAASDLESAAGVWLVPGGPYKNNEAALSAIDYCIGSDTPFLGICSGFQYACLALARRQHIEAAHAELDPEAPHPMIAPLQCTRYGEERLVEPVEGTRLASICGIEPFLGFYYCGFGLAAEHEHIVEDSGAVISARSPDAGEAIALELPSNRFFLATAFQPQVGTSATRRLHPLLCAFLESTRAMTTSNLS